MRVLLITQFFAPEVGATQNRMMEFARAFVRAGHRVDVLTEVPNHPSGIIAPAFRRGWIHVEEGEFRTIRVWVVTSPRKTFYSRTAFYLSFLVMAVIASFRLPARYDAVVATSPPLPVAVAGLIIARLKRAPFVMDVRDLWPRAAVALGELSDGPLYRLAEKIESWLYRHAALISATTDEFCSYIRGRGIGDARVRHVPNGTRTDVFTPGDAGAPAFRRNEGLEGKFVVMYAGLHGIAQGLETVLDAASSLSGDSDVVFVLLGEGPRKDLLVQSAAARRLANVRFLPERPVTACASAIAAADVMLIPLAANPVFEMFVPSKLFDAMAAGRPVILSVPGEAQKILEQSGAGCSVPPGDGAAMADAIRQLKGDPGKRATMGANGRRFVEHAYDRRRESDRFTAAVEQIAGASR